MKAQLNYWHRLENLCDQFPLLKDAFTTSKLLYEKKLPSWYGSICTLINILFDQSSYTKLKNMSIYTFKKTLKIAMKTYYINFWHKEKGLLRDGKLCTYLKVKQNFGFENYLSIISDFEQRRKLTRFRLSAHRLRIEIGRYECARKKGKQNKGTPRQDRLCLHCCSDEIEDEEHFLFNCTKFSDDRSQFINAINDKCANYNQLQVCEKLIWLLNNEDIQILKPLCNFLQKHFVPNT